MSKELSEAVRDSALGGERRGIVSVRNHIKSAESGNVMSMNFLATSYKYGFGDVKADQSLSFKYSKMAADAGDAKGIMNLASCYEEGLGTDQNNAKAAELWKKAVGMGAAHAVSQYARCLAEGIGVEQNPKEAARLFEMCASREEIDSWAAIQLASFYLRGFGVEKNEGKAKEWLDKLEKIAERSESLRDTGTLCLLCEFYMDGENGVGKDADRAFKMARCAEKRGKWWGYKFMARCYKDGIGVGKDIAKAKEYVEKALKACKCKGGGVAIMANSRSCKKNLKA